MSARLGQLSGKSGAVVVSVKVAVPGLSIVDQLTGAFRSGAVYRALGTVNEKLAIQMQEAMASSLDKQVKATGRQQRGGERLKGSILHEFNREVFANNFRVGIPAWMDRSPAKTYWRRIEEGDAATFNSHILFTNNISGGKRYGPYSSGGVSRGRAEDAPPGYKHMRMPQHKGPFILGIGPYPAYRYQEASLPVYRRANLASRYDAELKKVGVRLSDLVTKK
jgi:hypothetical protein